MLFRSHRPGHDDHAPAPIVKFPRFLPATVAALLAVLLGAPHVPAQQQAPGPVLPLPPGNPGPIDNLFVSGLATVRYQSFEGGFYSLEADGGGHYDPTNLAVEFRRDGMRVRFEGRVRPDVLSVHQYGQVLKLTSVQATNRFTGDYQGPFRLTDSSGVTATAEIRFNVSDTGSLFGLLDGGFGTTLYFRIVGEVNADGQGSFKLHRYDPAAPGAIGPAAGVEKIPLLFFNDGRVSGGALDPVGNQRSLRALLMSPTFLPGPPNP